MLRFRVASIGNFLRSCMCVSTQTYACENKYKFEAFISILFLFFFLYFPSVCKARLLKNKREKKKWRSEVKANDWTKTENENQIPRATASTAE